MATLSNFNIEQINSKNSAFSQVRTTIETTFYRNNVIDIKTPKEAYDLAASSPGTIITDMPVYKPEELGLPSNAKVLLFNDGEVTGRCAAARRIIGEKNIDENYYSAKLREAVYNTRFRKMYHAQAYIGLHEDFMVRAHLLVPENYENLLYNWLLNFQYVNENYVKMYKNSETLKNEGDIYIFSDPEWKDTDHPLGLTLFDPEHNCAAILGMRYFGEYKKGTLTLGWSVANRNNYASCHGGLKRYNLENNKKYIMGIFGLSGSGKSTITHEKHKGKYDTSILHDDAFIISTEDSSAVALEPTYFDKTQDYPTSSPDNNYLLTVQNCGVTLDENDRKVIVTEDLRNGNGRAIKSKLWAENRVDKFSEPVNAIIWLMKDTALPPVLKINNSELASVMGATLATKRTSAERVVGKDQNSTVIEPFANPFRTYPLENDYKKFKELFSNNKVECYVFNTGHFLNKKIPKEVTIDAIEKIVEQKAQFKKWGNFSNLEILEVEGFIPDLYDENYLFNLKDSINERIKFLHSKKSENGGRDALPEEAVESLQNLLQEINHINQKAATS